MKSKGIAYALLLPSFVLICGLQRIYIGKVGTGILWFFTLGLFGIGTLVDIFTLGGQVEQYNAKKQLKAIRKAVATPQ